jgi:hypothetical protein
MKYTIKQGVNKLFGSNKIDRRDFLKSGGILLATASLGGIILSPRSIMAEAIPSRILSEKNI